MGLFGRKRNKQANAEAAAPEGRTFDLMPPTESMTLESLLGVISNPSIDDLYSYIANMVEDETEFVTLTPMEAINGIRYMQAVQTPNGISLQLAPEQGGRMRLVEQIVLPDRLVQVMEDFYNGKAEIDLSDFRPVKF